MEHDEHEDSKQEKFERTPYDAALTDDSLTPDEKLDKVADEHEEVIRIKSPEADNAGKPANPESGGSPTRVAGGTTGDGVNRTGGTTGGNAPRGGASWD
jgi:hypothetical protein